MMQARFLLITFLSTVAMTLAGQMDEGYVNLIHDDLDNWESYGGEAPYEVENNMIVGTAVVNTPNTFLCTKEKYGDYVLEFDFYDEAPLNSGVMQRAQWRQQNDIRRVYGYQMEIDPSPRAYTGGIYDEARRGWIYPLHYNDKSRSAYRHGQWNSARVEAIGNNIRTFINGQPVANLVDDRDAEGMVCLQVHSIPEELAGKQVMWRDIRIKPNATEADHRTDVPLGPVENLVANTLTEEEKNKGWRMLFDGESTDQWRGAKLDDFPDRGWTVEDGVLSVIASDGGESTNGGDIITRKQYGDFDLKFEFMPTEGANSGVKYYVDPTLNKGTGSAIGLEYQILDDERHPDAKMGVEGNRTVGSLYDLIAADPVDVNRNKNYNINDWNRGRIVSKDGKVEHWLNGYKVVEYDRHSQMFDALVKYSKYKDWENFGRWDQGPILLQDHGDAVSFRSIKIREL